LRAFYVPEFGAPGVVGELSTPEPAEGQVLVRVKAVGINAMDPFLVTGAYREYMEHRLPLVPGGDYAGTVVALGPGVTGVAVGDEVFGDVGKRYAEEGALAELVAVDAALATKRPANVPAEQAAALPRAGGTALAEVDAARIGAGDTVLIVGAAGGVGSFATQLAVLRGARVIAATNSARADSVRALGASEVVDYAAGDFADQVRRLAPGGVAALIDHYHDAAGLVPLAALVREGGMVVSPVAMGAEQSLLGLPVSFQMASAAVGRAGELAGLVARGELRVSVDPYPLAEAGAALDRQATRTATGKVVVTLE
jgi:NADPH:quinone reductase-like Zn-dependent oxidoreductase